MSRAFLKTLPPLRLKCPHEGCDGELVASVDADNLALGHTVPGCIAYERVNSADDAADLLAKARAKADVRAGKPLN